MARVNLTIPDEQKEWVDNQPELNLSGLLQKAIIRKQKGTGYYWLEGGITFHSDGIVLLAGEDGGMHIGKAEDVEQISEAAGVDLDEAPSAEEIVEELSGE